MSDCVRGEEKESGGRKLRSISSYENISVVPPLNWTLFLGHYVSLFDSRCSRSCSFRVLLLGVAHCWWHLDLSLNWKCAFSATWDSVFEVQVFYMNKGPKRSKMHACSKTFQPCVAYNGFLNLQPPEIVLVCVGVSACLCVCGFASFFCFVWADGWAGHTKETDLKAAKSLAKSLVDYRAVLILVRISSRAQCWATPLCNNIMGRLEMDGQDARGFSHFFNSNIMIPTTPLSYKADTWVMDVVGQTKPQMDHLTDIQEAKLFVLMHTYNLFFKSYF